MPSSTSSSDGARRLAWLGGGILVFLLLNALARFGEHRGWLRTGDPAKLVAQRIQSVRSGADVWVCGNSLAEQSFDAELARTLDNQRYATVILGSATLEATAMVIGRALDKSQTKPRNVVVVISKDDFNRNGTRGESSAQYLQAFQPPSLRTRISSWIALHELRSSIQLRIRKTLTSSIEGNLGSKAKALTPEAFAALKSGTDDPAWIDRQITESYLANQGRDFIFNDSGVSNLVATCRKHAVPLTVILPPVSKAVAVWHDARFPNQRWETLRKQVLTGFQQPGVRVLDWESALPSNPKVFVDPYHVHLALRPHLTRWYVADLRESAATPPRTNP